MRVSSNNSRGRSRKEAWNERLNWRKDQLNKEADPDRVRILGEIERCPKVRDQISWVLTALHSTEVLADPQMMTECWPIGAMVVRLRDRQFGWDRIVQAIADGLEWLWDKTEDDEAAWSAVELVGELWLAIDAASWKKSDTETLPPWVVTWQDGLNVGEEGAGDDWQGNFAEVPERDAIEAANSWIIAGTDFQQSTERCWKQPKWLFGQISRTLTEQP